MSFFCADVHILILHRRLETPPVPLFPAPVLFKFEQAHFGVYMLPQIQLLRPDGLTPHNNPHRTNNQASLLHRHDRAHGRLTRAHVRHGNDFLVAFLEERYELLAAPIIRRADTASIRQRGEIPLGPRTCPGAAAVIGLGLLRRGAGANRREFFVFVEEVLGL